MLVAVFVHDIPRVLPQGRPFLDHGSFGVDLGVGAGEHGSGFLLIQEFTERNSLRAQ